MKWFLYFTILSLLGPSYSSFECDTNENHNFENTGEDDSGSCIRLYSNKGVRGGGGGGRRPPPNGNPRGPPNNRPKPVLIDPSASTTPGVKDLIDMGDLGRFEIKHMFCDGVFGNHVNSFDQLKGNPEFLRQYLIDVNRRMFKGNVLPVTINNKETFEKWIKQASKNPKRISLVDAELADIQKDIMSQKEFQDYLERMKTNPKDAQKNSLFTTNEKYDITEIILEMEGDNLMVRLERYETKLKLGMKSEEIYHYDPFDKSTTVIDVKNKFGGVVATVEYTSPFPTDIASHETEFTKEQLLENEKLTKEFWEKLFGAPVEQVGYKGPINDKATRYSEIETEYSKTWQNKVIEPPAEVNIQEEVIANTIAGCAKGGAKRVKRGASKCVFFIDSEGEIESIKPEEFLEVYEETGEEGRRRMTEMVKNNGDKIRIVDEVTGEEARRKINQLVHHTEMTVHGDLVETTGTIQDWRRWKTPVPNKPSEFVTAIHEAVSKRMNKMRLSASKIVNSLTNNPHIEGVARSGRTYGNLMMTKGIINGIIHDDTTALAVIGGRMGYDLVTEAAVDMGAKFFSTASKVGKGARALGKVAGPVGAAIDVGLGAWSLTKSVGRLKNATNSYDRDDAIADIVSESIDMTVAITATVLSLVFPPAAPLIFAAAFIISMVNSFATSIFHSSNEVSRINSEIPLSNSEKDYVFTSRLFDFFGLRGKDYIDYLVEEKRANDLAVGLYLDFLKNNTQFLGVVFPSRTLSYDGGCYIFEHYECHLGTWLGTQFCSNFRVVSRWCDRNGRCAETDRLCVDEKTKWEIYECLCDDEPSTKFGFPHRDSIVDFREKQKVFLERAIPGDVSGIEFRCKPGSLEYLDNRVSQEDSVNDYFCEHAIGLYRPKNERHEGQSFLIDLEDGNDKVIIDGKTDTTPYTFFMGNEGEKNFHGGNSKNDFILNGNCSVGKLSGYLYGGPKESDSLIIAPTCAKGESIRIQNLFMNDASVVSQNNRLDLRLQQIESIIGRPLEAEIVDVSCSIRRVFLNGGINSQNPDSILIESYINCPFDVQIGMSNYTNVLSKAKIGDITIYVGEDMSGSFIHHVKQERQGSEEEKTTVIFTQTRSEDIIFDDIIVAYDGVSLKIKDHPEKEPLTITYSSNDKSVKSTNQHQIFFNESSTETPKSFSVLLVPGNEKAAKDSPLMFYYNLGSHLSPEKYIKRVGSDVIPNIFNISVSNWDVSGGGKDDTFLLNAPLSQLRINGGGGDDTLVVQSKQDGVINLMGDDRIKGIETVIKSENAGPINIITGCETKAIVVQGGNKDDPDTVRIGSCKSQEDLQIDAGGSAKVIVDGEINGDNGVVRVLAHKVGQHRSAFTLDVRNRKVANLLVQVLLESPNQYPDLIVEQFARAKDFSFFQMKLVGEGLEHLSLNLMVDENINSPYIASPHIQLIRPLTQILNDKYEWTRSINPTPSQLVFNRETLQPVVIHVIQEFSKGQVVYGLRKLENLFQINKMTSLDELHGGEVKDTFIGTSTALSFGMISGNFRSDNTLIVKDDLPNSPESMAVFQIDLNEKRMGLLLKDSSNQAKVEGDFHDLIGRTNQPDKILPDCATKTVVGRGGSAKDSPDEIEIIPNRNGFCPTESQRTLEMHLGPFTKVKNMAYYGIFKYFLDLTQAAEFASFSLVHSERIDHRIVFTLPSLETGESVKVEDIKFDEKERSLVFVMKDHSSSDGVYEFPMYRKDDQSDYSNPKFLLTTSGDDWVTTDVRVDNQGRVIATSLVDGYCSMKSDNSKKVVKGLPLDINNFLVNITGDGEGSCGKVQGDSGANENHIWLFDLPENKDFRIEGAQLSDDQIMDGVTNMLHIDDDLHGDKPVTVYLSPERGYLKRDGVNGTVELKWIDSLKGRSNPSSYDTVVPSCYTKQVTGVDLVRILLDPSEDCIYNLITGVDPLTRVEFDWLEGTDEEHRDNVTKFWNSTFHYRFSEPMSFEVVQSYPGMLDGTAHNFYLPFDLEDLEALEFDEDESELDYTVKSEKYSIAMVSQPYDEDQFYPQPNIVTRDGFRFQIGRDESVTVTGVLQGIQSQPRELLTKFQGIANRLGVTMVIQTDSAFMHIGNDGTGSDRNALQNVAFAQSFLGGGGAADTIYEVVSLDKDVYIETGLENVTPVPAVNLEGQYITKQIIDLTDIVAPIRFKSGKKYKPKVTQEGDDLIVTMEGYQTEYPGRLLIFGGSIEIVRKNLQILLSNAMMEFVVLNTSLNGPSWELSPVDVHLEREIVHSIAAEDLEDDHQIIVLDHKYGPEYHFRFNYSRNGAGDDLQLSDIEEFIGHKYDRKHIEMTTVIITDFYKNTSSSDSNSSFPLNEAPTEIRNVTLFLPGLTIKLDGTNVMLLSNENDVTDTPDVAGVVQNQSSPIPFSTVVKKFSLKKTSSPVPVLLTVGMIPTWTNVLHQVEDSILDDLPFVRRAY